MEEGRQDPGPAGQRGRGSTIVWQQSGSSALFWGTPHIMHWFLSVASVDRIDAESDTRRSAGFGVDTRPDSIKGRLVGS